MTPTGTKPGSDSALLDEIEWRLIQNLVNRTLKQGMILEAEKIEGYREKARIARMKIASRLKINEAYRSVKNG